MLRLGGVAMGGYLTMFTTTTRGKSWTVILFLLLDSDLELDTELQFSKMGIINSYSPSYPSTLKVWIWGGSSQKGLVSKTNGRTQEHTQRVHAPHAGTLQCFREAVPSFIYSVAYFLKESNKFESSVLSRLQDPKEQHGATHTHTHTPQKWKTWSSPFRL